jgi:hypothetical protein
MSEEDGVELLGPLRGVDAPPSNGVSVERAIRTVKRTRVLQLAAVVVLVLVATAVVPLTFRQTENIAAPTAFDLFVRTVSAGTEGGYRVTGYQTGEHWQIIHLGPERQETLARGTITVYAKGFFNFADSSKVVPDVNGRRAVWLGDKLAWQWAHDAWAVVEIYGFSDAESRSHSLATSVSFREHVPMTLPFTMSRPPWKLSGVRVEETGAELLFTNGVRVGVVNDQPSVNGPLSLEERDALLASVRKVDPPVTNPFR